jgi:hypothetical protein
LSHHPSSISTLSIPETAVNHSAAKTY